jgi:hypothetical protein
VGLVSRCGWVITCDKVELVGWLFVPVCFRSRFVLGPRCMGYLLEGRLCLGVGLEAVGRLSNDLAVMSNAKKVVWAVVILWECWVCLAVFLRRFLFAFALRMRCAFGLVKALPL